MRKGCARVHQRADVAHRADIHLAAREEGHGAVEIDGEAALHLVEDGAGDGLVLLEHLFEANPAFLAARLLARKHRLAERVLDPLQIDFHLVAGIELPVAAAHAEFLQRHPALDLQADIDDRDILLDGDDRPLDDTSLDEIVPGERFLQESGKILPGRLRLGCLHQNSFMAGTFGPLSHRTGRLGIAPAALALPLARADRRVKAEAAIEFHQARLK